MKNKINVDLLKIILVFILVFLFFGVTMDAIAYGDISLLNEDELMDESRLEVSSICSERIQIEFDDRPYSISETATLFYHIETNDELKDIQYNSIGFEVIQVRQQDENLVQVSLRFQENKHSLKFELAIVLLNERNLVSKIYGYQSNGFYYFSRASEENTDLLYYEYELRENRITLEEYENRVREQSFKIAKNLSSAQKSEENESFHSSLQEKVSAQGLVNTTIKGTWEWYDGVNYHPLKHTLLNITLYGNSTTLNQNVYTDANGYFSFTILLSESVDIFVEAHTEGKTILLKKNLWAAPYTAIAPLEEGLEPGGTAVINYRINDLGLTGKAFQVLQALIMGSKYVEAMASVSVSSTTCYFPMDFSQFNPLTGIIEIEEDAYNYWDIILHEYGHKTQSHFKMGYNLTGNHIIDEDQISNLGKDKGTRMAWGEGWATFFAILVTQYFGNELKNIRFINDNAFHSFYYNEKKEVLPNPFGLEDEQGLIGEGCEAAVFSVLYDLYDSFSIEEPWDRLSFSHQTMFTAVIESKAKTFSEFLNYFVQNYCSANDGKLGNILSHYGMTSTDIKIRDEEVSYLISPTFTWNAGGPEFCKFNSFKLIFYDISDSILFETERFTTTSFTLPVEQWKEIVKNSGRNTIFSVVSYQTATPATGPYYSPHILIDTPEILHEHSYFYKAVDSKTHRGKCSCGEVVTQPHTISSSESGNRYVRCVQCNYLLDLEKDFGIIGGGVLSLQEKTLWFDPKDTKEKRF